eukprot:1078460-Rhodomonas_salina.1
MQALRGTEVQYGAASTTLSSGRAGTPYGAWLVSYAPTPYWHTDARTGMKRTGMAVLEVQTGSAITFTVDPEPAMVVQVCSYRSCARSILDRVPVAS